MIILPVKPPAMTNSLSSPSQTPPMMMITPNSYSGMHANTLVSSMSPVTASLPIYYPSLSSKLAVFSLFPLTKNSRPLVHRTASLAMASLVYPPSSRNLCGTKDLLSPALFSITLANSSLMIISTSGIYNTIRSFDMC